MKLKLFIFTLLLFFVSVPASVYAEEKAVYDQYNVYDVVSKDKYPYVFYSDNPGNRCYAFLSNHPFVVNDINEKYTDIYVSTDLKNNPTSLYYCVYEIITSSSERVWKYSFSYGDLAKESIEFTQQSESLNKRLFKLVSANKVPVTFANHNVRNLNNESVFQLPPAVAPGIQEKVTTEILMTGLTPIKKLIPVILIVVVSFLAFWKAWQFLRTTLENS